MDIYQIQGNVGQVEGHPQHVQAPTRTNLLSIEDTTAPAPPTSIWQTLSFAMAAAVQTQQGAQSGVVTVLGKLGDFIHLGEMKLDRLHEELQAVIDSIRGQVAEMATNQFLLPQDIQNLHAEAASYLQAGEVGIANQAGINVNHLVTKIADCIFRESLTHSEIIDLVVVTLGASGLFNTPQSIPSQTLNDRIKGSTGFVILQEMVQKLKSTVAQIGIEVQIVTGLQASGRQLVHVYAQIRERDQRREQKAVVDLNERLTSPIHPLQA